MATAELGSDRRARLAGARLYLVCDGSPRAGKLADVIRSGAAGGVDVVQLREKQLPDDELTATANAARAVCKRLGVLFVVNDRPHVALEVGADAVHVGQDDMPPADVRALVGPDMLIGLSTHTPHEIDAVDPELVDYIGVGPIHETPTKEGRAAVGLELIAHAAASARVPFFAIGGLDVGNIAAALGAGATRVCVLRAIADATDPAAAARALRERIDAVAGVP